MLILAGLGNPGSKYAGHRHNIGFMAADEIVSRHGLSPWRRKFQSLVSDGQIAGQSVVVLKPQTYMNESGRAVGEAMRFFNLSPADVIVFYDELDLAPGKIRVKTGGGAGGHNGIKSLDAHCGKDYLRVRLGIGHPGDKEKVRRHVLGDFAKADKDWLEPLLKAVADHVGLLIGGDASTFMNKVALEMQSVSGTGLRARRAGSPDRAEQPARKPAGRREPGLARSGPMAEMLKRLLGKGE